MSQLRPLALKEHNKSTDSLEVRLPTDPWVLQSNLRSKDPETAAKAAAALYAEITRNGNTGIITQLMFRIDEDANAAYLITCVLSEIIAPHSASGLDLRISRDCLKAFHAKELISIAQNIFKGDNYLAENYGLAESKKHFSGSMFKRRGENVSFVFGSAIKNGNERALEAMMEIAEGNSEKSRLAISYLFTLQHPQLVPGIMSEKITEFLSTDRMAASLNGVFPDENRHYDFLFTLAAKGGKRAIEALEERAGMKLSGAQNPALKDEAIEKLMVILADHPVGPDVSDGITEALNTDYAVTHLKNYLLEWDRNSISHMRSSGFTLYALARNGNREAFDALMEIAGMDIPSKYYAAASLADVITDDAERSGLNKAAMDAAMVLIENSIVPELAEAAGAGSCKGSAISCARRLLYNTNFSEKTRSAARTTLTAVFNDDSKATRAKFPLLNREDKIDDLNEIVLHCRRSRSAPVARWLLTGFIAYMNKRYGLRLNAREMIRGTDYERMLRSVLENEGLPAELRLYALGLMPAPDIDIKKYADLAKEFLDSKRSENAEDILPDENSVWINETVKVYCMATWLVVYNGHTEDGLMIGRENFAGVIDKIMSQTKLVEERESPAYENFLVARDTVIKGHKSGAQFIGLLAHEMGHNVLRRMISGEFQMAAGRTFPAFNEVMAYLCSYYFLVLMGWQGDITVLMKHHSRFREGRIIELQDRKIAAIIPFPHDAATEFTRQIFGYLYSAQGAASTGSVMAHKLKITYFAFLNLAQGNDAPVDQEKELVKLCGALSIFLKPFGQLVAGDKTQSFDAAAAESEDNKPTKYLTAVMVPIPRLSTAIDQCRAQDIWIESEI
ncbi:MAG: hypothetical protein ABH825_03045 [Candidatus Omnitrophota bacterium]